MQDEALARKFHNPTDGWIGANKYGPDGKPTATAVPPHGDVWLTEAEERMTAEAPRMAEDNPFVKKYRHKVGENPDGTDIFEERTGTLVLSDEEPRPISSTRFTPAQAERVAASEAEQPAAAAPPVDPPSFEPEGAPTAEKGTPPTDTGVQHTHFEPPAETPRHDEVVAGAVAPEVLGAPAPTHGEPVLGQAAENEVVATPEAVAANEEELARRRETGPVPLGDKPPQTTAAIGVQQAGEAA
jgi:hypothetical protein